jgi:hypothetical protein
MVGRIQTPAEIYARAAASPTTATLANIALPGGINVPAPGPTVDLTNPVNPKIGGTSATDAAGAVGGAITDPAGALKDLGNSAVGGVVGDVAGTVLGPISEVVLMGVLVAAGTGLVVYAVIRASQKSGLSTTATQAATAAATGGASTALIAAV